MPAQNWTAQVGDKSYPVVAFLTDPAGVALHGQLGAAVVVDGQLRDSRDLARERGPLTFKQGRS